MPQTFYVACLGVTAHGASTRQLSTAGRGCRCAAELFQPPGADQQVQQSVQSALEMPDHAGSFAGVDAGGRRQRVAARVPLPGRPAISLHMCKLPTTLCRVKSNKEQEAQRVKAAAVQAGPAALGTAGTVQRRAPLPLSTVPQSCALDYNRSWQPVRQPELCCHTLPLAACHPPPSRAAHPALRSAC